MKVGMRLSMEGEGERMCMVSGDLDLRQRLLGVELVNNMPP